MADMPLPQAAIAALQRGDKLTAIRIVREATGLDLKQAAVAVEMHGRRHRAASTGADAAGRQDIAQQILGSLLGGKKAEAVQLLRDHVNKSGNSDVISALQTAERVLGAQRGDSVAKNEHRSEHRLDAERARGSARLQALIHQKRVPTVSPGDAPGGGVVWVLVAMAAAILWLMLAVLGG
mgnify:FL=1